MKDIIVKLIAVVILFVVIFAILYWLFDFSKTLSTGTAISGILGGLLAPYLVSLFKKKNKTTLSNN